MAAADYVLENLHRSRAEVIAHPEWFEPDSLGRIDMASFTSRANPLPGQMLLDGVLAAIFSALGGFTLAMFLLTYAFRCGACNSANRGQATPARQIVLRPEIIIRKSCGAYLLGRQKRRRAADRRQASEVPEANAVKVLTTGGSHG